MEPSEAAVEAAAKAEYAADWRDDGAPEDWEKLPDEARDCYLVPVRAALSAALPIIRREIVEEIRADLAQQEEFVSRDVSQPRISPQYVAGMRDAARIAAGGES